MIFDKIEKESKGIVFVYTTCKNIDEARRIGLSSINEKLAISADYWFINSIYPWKNVLQEVDQCMLMLVTQKEFGDKLIKHIQAEHSYSVPMIVMSDTIMTSHDYSFWVDSILTSKVEYLTEVEAEKQKKEKESYHYDRLK